MILSLKNIGKVESAKVELNGITVLQERMIPERVRSEKHYIVFLMAFTK